MCENLMQMYIRHSGGHITPEKLAVAFIDFRNMLMESARKNNSSGNEFRRDIWEASKQAGCE